MRFTLRLPDGTRAGIVTPALGRHSVHNALAAAAVGFAAGLATQEIVRGLEAGFRAPHRTHLVRAGSWRILDDSYNAAPDSMTAALELLATLPGRHVAVLGEMLELGERTEESHREVGRRAAQLADRLVVVGEGARLIAEAALEAGMPSAAVDQLADRDAAIERLAATLEPDDTILVKASRGAELDLLVNALVEIGASQATGEASRQREDSPDLRAAAPQASAEESSSRAAGTEGGPAEDDPASAGLQPAGDGGTQTTSARSSGPRPTAEQDI
jgi:UDP-N-acetylmuramoyl-tripeptide--D-alanyl-D-alanine ligase